MEDIEKIDSVMSGFSLSLKAIDSYLCKWFEHLPLEGMEDIMGNYNSPDREDYTRDQEGEEEYQYELEEYMDEQLSLFNNVNLEIKLSDFKENAHKYADQMKEPFTF